MVDRIMIFIDANNLFKGAKGEGITTDYSKLIPFLVGDNKLIRTYYYCGMPHKGVWDSNFESWEAFSSKLNKQKKFLDKLRFDYGFHVVTRPLVLIDGKRKEKGIDVHLACDVIWHGLSDNYDTAILISGDKDLLECISRMKDCGKNVIVANFQNSISRSVQLMCDKYVDLSAAKEKIRFDNTQS